jgi:hypothetical protein
VEAAEWNWRGLDETASRVRGPADGIRNRDAKEEREKEVSRLRAHLAVASFLEGLQAQTRTDGTNAMTVQVDLDGDRYDVASRLGFAMLVQPAADPESDSGVDTWWRPTASKGDPTTGEWWISLEASTRSRGQELSRHRFRFKVVDDHVEGWLGVAESSLAEESRQASDKAVPALERPMRFIASGLDRLVRSGRSA